MLRKNDPNVWWRKKEQPMSLTSSLYTGVTGLLTYGKSLSVIGNNLANVNTVGFKHSRAEFADLLTTVEGRVEIGHGVRLANTSRLFTQGALQTTESVTDLAIQGNGLFVVRDAAGGTYYTRAGQFHVDKLGRLVNGEGYTVQGFQVDDSGTPIGGLGAILLGDGISAPPTVTTTLALAANLNAASKTPEDDWPGGAGTDAPQDEWLAASNFSTTVTVYDSLGQAHDLTFLFRKTDTNTWDYRVVAPITDLEAEPENPDNWKAVGEGSLKFTEDGVLDIEGSTLNDIELTDLVSGAADLTISKDTLDLSGFTQYAQPSAVSLIQQDGTGAGALVGIDIDQQGIVTGRFSNGSTRALYRVALADFASVEGLLPVGNTLFAQSSESGSALIGTPGTGSFGTVVSGGLELSTVDVTQEFVSLIASQRGFQVNSRVVTVADQMYEEVANLKR
jgi:flagellar hook protein FlgE